MKVDEFFKYLHELNKVNKKINKEFKMTPELVYNELIYFQNEKCDIRHLFNRWIDRFSSRPGIKVFKNNNFCSFISGNINLNNSYKLYISLSKNIDENVTKIFEYLRSNSINHISKVGPSTRNDLLTIRVDNKENVSEIINYLVNSNIINDINNTLPFTLETSKIGVCKDGLYTYTFEICKLISECINKNIKLNSKVFSNYVNQKRIHAKDENLKLIYKVCFVALSKNSSLDNLNDINLDKKESTKILNEVLKKTKDKYGVKHTKKALLKYLKEENLSVFTRGEKEYSYRVLLSSSLNKESVKKILINEVGENKSIKNLAEKYVNLKFANEISQAKEKKIKKENIIFNCCTETYQKHGYNYALGALRAFKYGSLDLFDINDKLKSEISIITKEEIDNLLKGIIYESYPNMNELEFNSLEKQNLIETIIMNLVKGYVDIQ